MSRMQLRTWETALFIVGQILFWACYIGLPWNAVGWTGARTLQTVLWYGPTFEFSPLSILMLGIPLSMFASAVLRFRWKRAGSIALIALVLALFFFPNPDIRLWGVGYWLSLLDIVLVITSTALTSESILGRLSLKEF